MEPFGVEWIIGEFLWGRQRMSWKDVLLYFKEEEMKTALQ